MAAHLGEVLCEPGVVEGAVGRLGLDLLVLVEQPVPEEERGSGGWEDMIGHT